MQKNKYVSQCGQVKCVIEEIYKGLTCMESRIEVLETILLEKGKKYERI